MKKRFNKFLSVLLALTIVVSTFAGLSYVSAAANPYFNKVADSATLDGWKEFFGTTTPSTENAGGVWTDKSVFADNSHEAFQNLTDAYGNDIIPTVTDDSFLVALSAIASNKSIVGYSHIPTDTVLVLDISGSMGPDDNDAIEELVLAANAAITELMELNNNNRVGIVLYSAEYEDGNPEHYYTLLPIDRYSATDTVTYNNGTPRDDSDDITVGKYLEMGDVYREVTVTQGGRPGRPGSTTTETRNMGDGIGVADGVTNGSGNDASAEPIWVVGGTFIQGGLQAAANLFKAKSDDDDTVIKGDGFQSGTQRKPVMVLMSDGAPTYATANYKNPTEPTLGTGHNTDESYAFLTQLTAANVKNTISSYYNDSEALFYTLGLGVGNSAVAQSVLDPQNSTVTINGYWEDFAEAANNSTVQITNGVSVVKDDSIDDIVYTNQYFEAQTGADLFVAFDSIVNEIIIQSLYRPTLVEMNNADMEGYIEFIDDIGDYMKIEEIEGIMIGDKLFTGEKLAENFQGDGGELGTVENPNALGDNLVWSVKERLGISDTAIARELITQAYTHGQLNYSKSGSDVTFSNYIGWYADENGNYLGFWCDKHTYKDIPDGAKFINKSYGMLGEISDKYTASDLMYVSIQVHTEIVEQSTFNLKDTDNIMAGHAQLVFRVPASLIPVVNYEVELEGTGYDDAKNITMTVNDAEPIRLLFEVGLRNDVNEYNIEAVLGDNNRDASGNYVFYTNQWSAEQFDKEIDPNHTDHIDPSDAINTVAYFEPNYENERYYYTEPTPVYVKQGSEYVKYSSTTQPTATDGNEYYRQINVFELTGNGNEAVHNKLYERISDTALSRVEKSETNGGWNIKKDTIHRVYDEIETSKTSNATGTLGYSYFPTVEHIEGTHYYADAILGNNGKLTVTSATGISITKTVDASLEGNTDEYTFNVDIGDAAASYSVVRKGADGMFADFGEKINLDADGKGTVTLIPGETVLIVGIPDGTAYLVEEEIPSGANYEVSESSGTTGTVEQNHLSVATFENAIRQNGSLIIAKHIEHPFVTAPDSINNHVFKFDAVLSAGGTAYPDATVEAYYSTAPDDKFELLVVNNQINNIELKGNQSIIIKIKDGWTAEVTEQGAMPQGFTLTNTEATNSKTVTTTANVEYVFTNTYNPDDVTADITIDASKVLNGRPWNNDEFTFALYRYNKQTAQYDEIVRETVDAAGDFGETLTAAMKQEVFSEVGEYHYMVRELVPNATKGITYDEHYRIFTIVVTDTNTDGKLEISDVEASNAVTVTANGDAYTVDAEPFVNVYKADGIAEVTIEINKTVDAPDGIDYSAEGFEFGVYDQSGALVSPLYTTDADGKTQFVFTYGADGVDYQNDKVYNYVIKETNTGLGGITYAEDIPFTVTVKDNLDGTISATTNITNKNGNVSVVDVTNLYRTNNISVTLEVSKNITGRGLNDGEFKFDLYSLDTNTVVVDNATNDATGKVTFNLPAFQNVGTYNYKVYEDEVNANGVTVDTTEHNVTVVIDHDGKGNLTATVNGTLYDGNAINVGAFNNTYNANSVDVTLEATKELTGRDIALADKEFNFALKDVDNDVVKQDNATNDVNGKVVFNALTFDTVGTYNYLVYENETDANGITVDTKKYNVTITVADNGQGNLVAEVKVDNTTVTGSTANVIKFTNVYSADSVNVTLEATKTLTGRDLVNGEFKFAIKDTNTGTVVQDNATNDADGKVVFNSLTFDKVGTYNYVVYENEVDKNGITVDKTQHNVEIVVTDNQRGQLVATVNGVEANTAINIGMFANTYKTATTDIVIEATKVLDGRDLADGEFEFELYYGDKVIATAKNDADGNITFENVVVDDAGKYEFTVKEVKGNDQNVTYDESVFTVTVTVTDNLDGTLELEYDYANEDGKVEKIVFNNKYTEPTPEPQPEPKPEPQPEPQPEPTPEKQPESPKTGDNVNLAGWLAVVFTSGAILFATGKKLKKVKKS